MTDNDTTTNPREMDALYKVFRAGFLESGEGWNGETYHGNPAGYERRLQARFEALCNSGEFDAVSGEKLRSLIQDWRDAGEYAKDAGNIHEHDGIMGCADELEALLQDE